MGPRIIVISLAFASCNREQAPDVKPIAASPVPSPGAEQLLKPRDWVVFVEHKENFRPPSMVTFPLPAKVTERDVWTSAESECACKAEFYQDGQQFNFSCSLPNDTGSRRLSPAVGTQAGSRLSSSSCAETFVYGASHVLDCIPI
jgi:hypothetical protein